MSFSETLSPHLTSDKDDSHLNFNSDMGNALERFLADAQSAGHDIQIYSGFRSNDRQAELFANAVEQYGSEAAARRYVAPPGRSQHNHGNAADLRYGNDAAKEWAHANAERYGLNFRMDWEPWHIEFAGHTNRSGNETGVDSSIQYTPVSTVSGNSEEDGEVSALASAILNESTPNRDAPSTVSASEDATTEEDGHNADASAEMTQSSDDSTNENVARSYSAYMMQDNPYQDSRRKLVQTSAPIVVQTVSMDAYSTPDPFKSQGVRFSVPFLKLG